MTAPRLARLQKRMRCWLSADARRTRGVIASSHQERGQAMPSAKGHISHRLCRLATQGVIRIGRSPGGLAEYVTMWAYPDRSLTKAAQTVQKHALHLARACSSVQRLGRALLTVKRCLAAGCRMNRRKKHPNTYQLLLQATGP
jgi:hypothetical protein